MVEAKSAIKKKKIEKKAIAFAEQDTLSSPAGWMTSITGHNNSLSSPLRDETNTSGFETPAAMEKPAPTLASTLDGEAKCTGFQTPAQMKKSSTKKKDLTTSRKSKRIAEKGKAKN